MQLNLLHAMLEDVPFYRSLPIQTAQNAVCRSLKWEKYRAGETICAEGDIGEEFYIIGAGEVDVSIEGNKITTLASSHDPMQRMPGEEAESSGDITTATGSPRSSAEGGAFGSISLTGQTTASRRRTATCVAGVSSPLPLRCTITCGQRFSVADVCLLLLSLLLHELVLVQLILGSHFSVPKPLAKHRTAALAKASVRLVLKPRERYNRTFGATFRVLERRLTKFCRVQKWLRTSCRSLWRRELQL